MKIGNRRASFIDYKKPGIFMITVNKSPGISPFSVVNPSMVAGQQAQVSIKDVVSRQTETISVRPDYTDLGYCIYRSLKEFDRICQKIKIRQYIIMPDHLHVLLEITQPLEEPLGNYMGRIYNYIRTNPYRLYVRLRHPEFFTKIEKMVLAGEECSVYGNLNLLHNPFIYPVVIHRRDTEAIMERNKELWRYVLCNGGVLAGGFIAPKEKAIFKGAAAYGGKLILISNRAFGEREKPGGALFKLCETGRLLIISPKMDFGPKGDRISRRECLHMNSFAGRLARSLGAGAE